MNRAYLNASLSPDARTEILLSEMTVEEKVGQLMQISCMKADPKFEDGKATGWIYGRMDDTDRNSWVLEKFAGSFLHVLGDEIDAIQEMALKTRLGIPVLFGIDAIHGHALHNGATIFPSQLAMSCNWDRNMIEQMGRVTAREVAADGIHWTFSPVLCIARDLRWGRVNETFGEDPYLIGELGMSIIKGYQGRTLSDPDSILACAKHYLAYGESTGGRDAYDAQISMRKAREVFLPPFEKAVEAGCATFMTGYQSVDGRPVTIHEKLIKDVLKAELGFDGFVVTDWNNTESLITQQRVVAGMDEAATQTLLAGNDMIMNTPAFYETMVRLVKNHSVKEEALDEAVRRILRIKFRMGLFEKAAKHVDAVQADVSGAPDMEKENAVYACEKHLNVNLELTRKSVVLLENKKNLLPLTENSQFGNLKKIAVIGPNADDIAAQYGDWTYFTHPYPKDEKPQEPFYTMLRGIREISSKYGIQVDYSRGCHLMHADDAQVEDAVSVAENADLVVAVVGDCIEQNGEFKDRANLDLSGAQQHLLERLKETGRPLVVVMVNGKPLTVPWIKEHADAVIETFNAGMFGGKVVGEILFGETCPTGKLSISFAQHTGQLPVYYNQLPGWHGSKYIDFPMEPLYPFGYGLSFTEFEYANLKLSKHRCSPEETIMVSVDVTNTGSVDSEEIVQLYVNDAISSVMTPFMELKGFKRVVIRAGETITVNMKLSVSDLYVIDLNEEKTVEAGTFEIMVGPDSRQAVLLKSNLTVA